MPFAKRISFFLALLFCSSALFAQMQYYSGHLQDKEGHPIVNVRVHSLRARGYTNSDTRGCFAVEVLPGDTLLLSHRAYKTQQVPLAETYQDGVIRMAETKMIVPTETATTRPSQSKEERVGFKKQVADHRLTMGPPAIMAIRIDNPHRTPALISAVHFPMHPHSRHKVDLGIRLHAVDPATGGPGEELTPESFVVPHSRLNGEVSLDISGANLQLPPEGIFVSLQWLGEIWHLSGDAYPEVMCALAPSKKHLWLNLVKSKGAWCTPPWTTRWKPYTKEMAPAVSLSVLY